MESLKKLIVDEKKCCVHTKWEGEVMHIKLLDYESNKGWSGKMTKQDIFSLASSGQMSTEEFLKETKLALQGEGEISEYQYGIKDGIFSWKKVVEEGISFNFGSAAVKKVPANKLIPEFFDQLFKQRETFQRTISQLQQREQQLENERQMLFQRCENYVAAKEKVEAELYSRFAAVLNTKKARISELLSSSVSTPESFPTKPETNGKSPKPRKLPLRSLTPKKDETVSTEDDDAYNEDTDVDTDEEREIEIERRKKRRIHQ